MGLTNFAAASKVINPKTDEIKDRYRIPYNNGLGLRVNVNGASI